MINLIVRTAERGLRGAMQVPGDKSISHRALMLASLAAGMSRVRGWLPANDCYATWRCMQSLGVDITAEREYAGDGLSPLGADITIRSEGRLVEPQEVLDCGGSGTTARLLAGLLAGQGFCTILTGNPQLRRRPMGRVADPLRQMGATILGRDQGQRLPLAIAGGGLRAIDYSLPMASGQVKSALLLAGLFANGETVVREPGPGRDHTERMLRAMGGDVRSLGPEPGSSETGGAHDPARRIAVRPLSGPLAPLDITVPGDISSAAFLIVAAVLVPDSEVTLTGVGLNPTRTGLMDALQSMGADVQILNVVESGGELRGDLVIKGSELQATEIGGSLVPRMIDEFPIFAVAATQARGRTIIHDAAELRVKESDRIAALAGELRRLGAQVEEFPDGLAIEGPVRLVGATVDSHGDHRLAMSLAVAGVVAEGDTHVRDTACVVDSFPGFAATLQAAGVAIAETKPTITP